MTLVTTTEPSKAGASAGRATAPTSSNARNTAKTYDQFYTTLVYAAHCYAVFCRFFDPSQFLMIEPAAGTGAFFRLLPKGSLGYDLFPKFAGIIRQNFLTVDLPVGRPITVIGNPPYGCRARLAIDFFNRAASVAQGIAFIMPRSIRKAALENKLDRRFRMIHEEPVPAGAFLFLNKPHDVPSVFQIWQRCDEERELKPIEKSHPDFTFTTIGAEFAIRRNGFNAGEITTDLREAKPGSHYFVKCNVPGILTIFNQIDFRAAAGNVTGARSISQSEIIALYREFVALHHEIA